MRLLPPRRISEIARTGSAQSARATSWMSSVAAEERVTDFVPGGILLELTLRLAAEQDLSARSRHLGVAEDLGKIVDEYVAFKRPDAPHLVVPRAFEIDVVAADAEARRVEEAIALHPAQRGHAQIGHMGVVMRKLGLVADDRHHIGARPAGFQEVGHAVEKDRGGDPPAIDQPLQALPKKAVRALSQQGALDGSLVALERRWQQPLLLGHALERLVVGDQRVVEIDADSHRGKPVNNVSRMSRARRTCIGRVRAIFSQLSVT